MAMDKYTWDALDYEKSSSVQQMWARELIAKLDLKGDERVLDIGCGDGKITAEIAAKLKNGTVVGIDSSYEMIQLAQARHAKGDLANILFSEHDARRHPFRCCLLKCHPTLGKRSPFSSAGNSPQPLPRGNNAATDGRW